MKKIASIVLITVMLFCFAGCAKLINTETQEVEATVTDVYYKGAWVQPISTGKTTTWITHPAKYIVTFTYENVTLTANSKRLYDYYKDKIGATVKCDLIIEYYDDGSTWRKLELKEEVN